MNIDRKALISKFRKFYSQNLITDILNIVKSGKEATIYRCRAHPSTGQEFLVAKFYRPFNQRSFKNDAIYQQCRREWSGGNARALKRKSKWGREAQFSNWVNAEFGTLHRLYRAGANVPQPFGSSRDTILMEYLGDGELSAPKLNDISLNQNEAETLYRQIMQDVQIMLDADRIHGDLSAFNILYWQNSPKIIDFPQSIHPRRNPQALSLLQRDIKNLYKYFSRYGIEAEPFQMAKDLWTGFLNRRSENAWKQKRDKGSQYKDSLSLR